MNEAPSQALAIRALHDWLIDEAGFLDRTGLVLEGLCTRLLAAGLPLVRATAHLRVLHSERIGLTDVWRRGQVTRELTFGFGSEVEVIYRRSPIRVVHETKQRMELRPAEPDAAAYGITADLQAAGVTHYVAFPLLFTGGHLNVVTFATDRAEGFQPPDLALIEELLPALARVMELKGLLRSRRELLQIYVGRLPAERILDGQIRRGDVVETQAAILLCDLRGSTQLAIDLEESVHVRTLNRFFDCVVPAITLQGGEILKFIGDAVLAIFAPARAGDRSHCDQALAAAEAIFVALREANAKHVLPSGPLRVAIGLHEGRLAFGNVGSVERQDFTVIGPDVNLVARLCTLSAELGEPLLTSERFAAHAPASLRRIGEFPLKGFLVPQAIFAASSA